MQPPQPSRRQPQKCLTLPGPTLVEVRSQSSNRVHREVNSGVNPISTLPVEIGCPSLQVWSFTCTCSRATSQVVRLQHHRHPLRRSFDGPV